MPKKYRIYRGDVDIYERDVNGWPIKGRNLGETPRLVIGIEETFADNYETSSAFTRRDLHISVRTDVNGTVVLKEASNDNLALMLKGQIEDVAATPFTNLAFRNPVVAGETDALPGGQVNLSTATITDSAGSPATLVAGTNYTIDLKYGTITWLLVTGFTQPFKLAGTPNAHKYVSMFTDSGKEYWLRLKGLSIAQKPIERKLVELYRVTFDTPKEVKYKDGESNEVMMYEIPIIPLADDTKPQDDLFGQFGREVDLG